MSNRLFTLAKTPVLGLGVFLVLLLNVVAQGQSPPGCVAPPSNLVAWWRGEGDALDFVGENSADHIKGSPRFVPGWVGSAMKFGGQDGFAVSDRPSLDFGAGDSFTIEAWLRVDGTFSTDSILVEKRQSLGPVGYSLSLLGPNQVGRERRLLFNIQTSNTPGQFAGVETPAILDDGFHHVAAVVNRADNTLGIYLDGVLRKSASAAGVGSLANTGRFAIGHNSDDTIGSTAVDFNGVIDELAVFRRALSAMEVKAIFESGSVGKCSTLACEPPPAGLAAWFRAESNATDTVGNNHGALFGGAGFAPGLVGKAFGFDGVNDHVDVAPGSYSEVQSNFTIEFWAFPTAGRNPTSEITSGTPGIGSQRYAVFPDNADLSVPPPSKPMAGAGVSVGTNGVSVFEHAAFYIPSTLVYSAPVIGWTHIAVVYENNRPSLYINGSFARQGLQSPRTVFASASMSDRGSLYGPYAGLLDELSIYRRALSPAEIFALFASGSEGKCVPDRPSSPSISPANLSRSPGETQTFTVSGGAPPYTFTFARNGSAGLIASATGQYTAGPRAGMDVIVATDASGQKARATVSVTTPTFRISGIVTDRAGTALSDVTVSLSGPLARRTHTVDGLFAFDTLPANGNYTVAATLGGLDFGGAKTFAKLTEDQVANFQAVESAGQVRGRVAKADGTPLANTTVNASILALLGPPTIVGSAQTDADGTFQIENLPLDQTCHVAPVSSEFLFTPSVKVISVARGGATADFTATPAFRISGQLTVSGGSPGGVSITIRRATIRGRTADLEFLTRVTTDASGRFTSPLLAAGLGYSLIPTKPNCLFDPTSRLVESLTNVLTDVNFSGRSLLRAIRGSVVDSVDRGVGDISVWLTRQSDPSFNRQVSSDSSGEFAFVDLPPANDFIVLAEAPAFEITPASTTVNVLDRDVSGIQFTARGSFRVTGRATTLSGEPLPRLQVRLLSIPSGRVRATVFTGTDGSYDAGTHREGSRFVVSPHDPAFTFTPLSNRVDNLTSDETIDFRGQRHGSSSSGVPEGSSQTFLVDARVRTSAGSRLPLVAFRLDGAVADQPVTYNLGSFRAALPRGLPYTLTPQREGFGFDPSSITFTDSIPNPIVDVDATPVLPLGGRIAFVLGSTVAIMNADGSDAVTLPLQSSPSSSSGNFHEIELDSFGWATGRLEELSTSATSLANTVSTAQELGNTIFGNPQGTGLFSLNCALSPDGRQVAFVSILEQNSTFGSVFEFVTKVTGVNEFAAEEIRRVQAPSLGSAMDGPGQIAWSPDGLRLALAITPFGFSSEGLQIVTRDGGSAVNVLGTVNGDHNPTWSPDGSRLAFARPGDPDGSSDIYTINLTGRAELNRLTANDADDTDPAWSPDGSRIAFASNRNGHYDIYVMNANGLLETRITSTDHHDRHPTWSPDGSMLAFDRTVANDTNTVHHIYAMTASGANATFLMVGEKPSWGPTPAVAAPTGILSTVSDGSVAVTFAGVANADTTRDTTIIPTPPAVPSDFPPGYVAIGGAGVSFEIQTEADYTAPIVLCFTLSDIDDEDEFNALAVLHAENGSLVDRTIHTGPRAPNFAARQICAQVDSLSPFQLAIQVNATKPRISGLLLDDNGVTMPFTRVRLGGPIPKDTLSDANGRFTFANLQANASYTVLPADARHDFSPRAKFVSKLTGEVQLAFVGSSKSGIELSVALDPAAPGKLTISWSRSPAGLVLESTSSLTAADWRPSAETPTVANDRHTVTITVDSGPERYFRLRQP